MTATERSVHPASFRDPSGFLFERDGILYRQVNLSYREDYARLMGSGLYQDLVSDGMLVSHLEAEVTPSDPDLAYKVLRPERVPFVSYPYEWCFSQLKQAALLTLRIQSRAMQHGMSLKDASAFNVQFIGGRPLLIDSLSFEALQPGEPWTAYRQFCQHFLAPLLLMARVDVRFSQWLRLSLEGIPLDLASRLLDWRSFLDPAVFIHIHLHARAQKRFSGQPVGPQASSRRMSAQALIGLVDSLRGLVKRLKWKPQGTPWADYGTTHGYTEKAWHSKHTVVAKYLEEADPHSVWDLGANTGEFSRLASAAEIRTLSLDSDPAAVERNFLDQVQEGDQYLLPLVIDVTNPSPALGWAHAERDSLEARGPADLVIALALIHHLAIGNNLPLEMVAGFLRRLGNRLLIEFVPKSDPQTQRLLASRKDIFPGYHQAGFESAFGTYFRIMDRSSVEDSDRVIYLMEAL
jgi:ribosomal protein L11 methylase PrmA